MELTLVYKGDLKANGSVEHKQEIRRAIHKIKDGPRVGPRQVFDFMSQALNKEANFSLIMAILGLKLPLLG